MELLAYSVLTLSTVLGFHAVASDCRPTPGTLSVDAGLRAQIREFAPREAARDPQAFAIVILPPTGGSSVLDSGYARAICKKGVRAVVIENWTDHDETASDWQLHNRHFARHARVFARVMEHVGQSVKVLGTSVGGLYALTMLARRADVLGGAFITTGAPLHLVIARSSHEDLVSIKKERKQREGLKSQEEYERRLAEEVSWSDQELLATDAVRSKPAFFLVATEDTVVPTALQWDLAKLFPAAEVIAMDKGHLGGIVSAYWQHQDAIVDFLVRPRP